MKKNALPLIIMAVCVIFFGHGETTAGEVSLKKQKREIPREYTIKRGDTLWGLSKKFFQDPFKWPAIWGENAYIENPDLIYPGGKLHLFIPGTMVKPEERKVPQSSEAAAEAREEEASVQAAARQEPAPLRQYRLVPVMRDENLFLSAGFIEESDGQVGKIISSFQQRMQVIENDRVAVKFKDYIPRTGERLVVYSTLGEIRHPKTKKRMGNLIKILGYMKVSEKRGETYTARIIRAFDVMTMGDKVRKYEEIPMPLADPGRAPALKDISGYIVAVSEKKQYVGPISLIYIDRGKAHGVAAGDLFDIYEETPALRTDGWVVEKDESIPPVSDKVGEFRVLTVRENTSAGWLMNCTHEIEVGKIVRYAHRALE